MMNLKVWFAGLFGGNVEQADVAQVTKQGEEDGEQLARAYVGGFRRGIQNVLNEQLEDFHEPMVIGTGVVEEPGVLKQTLRRVTKKTGRGG